jgi:hypothetical protein
MPWKEHIGHGDGKVGASGVAAIRFGMGFKQEALAGEHVLVFVSGRIDVAFEAAERVSELRWRFVRQADYIGSDAGVF